MASLREILRYQSESGGTIFRIVQGSQYGTGPEKCSVIARTPGLLLYTAGLYGDIHVTPGLMRPDVLGRIKMREMLTDDFGRLVALDALCAGIPAGNETAFIKHDQRIFGHSFHKLADALLALAQSLLICASFCQVARNLGIANQRAAGVAHGRNEDIGPESGTVLA